MFSAWSRSSWVAPPHATEYRQKEIRASKATIDGNFAELCNWTPHNHAETCLPRNYPSVHKLLSPLLSA